MTPPVSTWIVEPSSATRCGGTACIETGEPRPPQPHVELVGSVDSQGRGRTAKSGRANSCDNEKLASRHDIGCPLLYHDDVVGIGDHGDMNFDRTRSRMQHALNNGRLRPDQRKSRYRQGHSDDEGTRMQRDRVHWRIPLDHIIRPIEADPPTSRRGEGDRPRDPRRLRAALAGHSTLAEHMAQRGSGQARLDALGDPVAPAFGERLGREGAACEVAIPCLRCE